MPFSEGLALGIDASRNRSGGAVTHLLGILSCIDLSKHGICSVHVWAHAELAAAIPNSEWLTVHSPDVLSKNIFAQIWWQYFFQEKEMKDAAIDICLNTDAGSVCQFSPSVTMSRNMLPFEFRELFRHGFSKKTLRLLLLRVVHSWSFKRSNGVIFLSDYAARVITRSVRPRGAVAVVPHGVDRIFLENKRPKNRRLNNSIRCIYVSNAAPYKHQWNVVSAIAALRKDGYDLKLELVGGGSGAAMKRLKAVLDTTSGSGEYVTMTDFVTKNEILFKLNSADLFLFASSCENFPNTLIEGMAAGIPIACSARGPMPEILRNGGVFFEPTCIDSIAVAIRLLIDDVSLSEEISTVARNYASAYSWEKCCDETIKFVNEVYSDNQ